MRARRFRLVLAATTAGVVAVGIAIVNPLAALAAVACRVTYTVPSQWPGGFTANVSVHNVGDPLTSWSLAWTFPAGQTISQIWNASAPTGTSQVTATNLSYNGSVPTNGTVSFGFNGAWSGSNPVPTAFTLNGTACNGGTTQPPTTQPPTTTTQPPTTTRPPTTTTTPPTTTTTPPVGNLPSSFQWSSSGVLAGPRPDAQHSNVVAIKDFSVVRHNNQWLIYATAANPSTGWSLVHFAFSDWPQAANAPHTYLDQSGIGSGYRAAPQLFFFAPQNLWYLVYQSAPPTYSTSTNPADPRSWSTPRTFIANEPPIVTQNKGPGQWIDFWVICDSANCYLFFSDDNGHQYRAQTTLANFPNGFGNTQIFLTDSRFALFEGSAVYKIQGQNRYLLIVEAIGSNGRRWYRSWTATSLTGTWTPLAATEANPFARSNNVSFPGGAWTQDIGHGELVRASNDQTLTLNPCRLQMVYQGMNPSASGDYIALPWRMGLLTQTNSPC
jgi:Glycosyl hydrolase family 62/Cellulose binding domain